MTPSHCERSLAVRLKVLDPHHPDVASATWLFFSGVSCGHPLAPRAPGEVFDELQALLSAGTDEGGRTEEGGGLKECIKTPDKEFCQLEYQSFFECKRGQLDMRTRIRGERSF
eukprot:g13622.t2